MLHLSDDDDTFIFEYINRRVANINQREMGTSFNRHSKKTWYLYSVLPLKLKADAGLHKEGRGCCIGLGPRCCLDPSLYPSAGSKEVNKELSTTAYADRIWNLNLYSGKDSYEAYTSLLLSAVTY